ncbi:MAG: HMA2 domain-containing protein [Ottowia sp.]
MQHLITSALPGRVRLRDPDLRRPRALAHMQGALRACAGVTRVKTNAHTGSVLLQYDSHALPPEQAHELLQTAWSEALALPADEPPPAEAAEAAEAAESVVENIAEGETPSASAAEQALTLNWPATLARPGAEQINRWVKQGMLLSLGATVALAGAGARRGHALAGSAFVALLLAHLYLHRSRLLK